MRKSPAFYGLFSTVASIPWCCILPGLLSIISLSLAAAARLWLTRVQWMLSIFSLLFLGRAFWLLYVKHEGKPWTHWVTWASMVFVFASLVAKNLSL